MKLDKKKKKKISPLAWLENVYSRGHLGILGDSYNMNMHTHFLTRTHTHTHVRAHAEKQK